MAKKPVAKAKRTVAKTGVAKKAKTKVKGKATEPAKKPHTIVKYPGRSR